MTKTKRIHISLPTEVVKELDKICKKSHMTRSEFIKHCIINPMGTITSDPIGLPKNQCSKCGGWFSDEAKKDHICE